MKSGVWNVPLFGAGELGFDLGGLFVVGLAGLDVIDARLALGLIRKFGVVVSVWFVFVFSTASN